MPEKSTNDPRVKPGIMSDGFIADVLEKEHVANSVKFGLQNGHDVYQEILSEAARRLRRYSGDPREDDQFAPHYEPSAAGPAGPGPVRDTHGEHGRGWYGFDLDGTLAVYSGWEGIDSIGEPVKPMVDLVKRLHDSGEVVKVVTARVAPRPQEAGKEYGEQFVVDEGGRRVYAHTFVEEWCSRNLGFVPEIVYQKDHMMLELYDDRVKQVVPNTGVLVEDMAKAAGGDGGDAADSRELRNALDELLSQDVCIQHGFDEGSPYCKDCGGRPPEHGGSGTCPWEIARAALSKPPRNCDVGSAKEQSRRFREFCDDLDCHECPVYELGDGSMEVCALTWAQMAYEKQEGK